MGVPAPFRLYRSFVLKFMDKHSSGDYIRKERRGLPFSKDGGARQKF